MRRTRWAVLLTCIASLTVALIYSPYIAVGELGAMLVFILYTSYRAQEHAHEVGYFEARTIMWSSISEAMDRGMSLDDWMEAEAERDRMRLAGGARKGLFLSPQGDED